MKLGKKVINKAVSNVSHKDGSQERCLNHLYMYTIYSALPVGSFMCHSLHYIKANLLLAANMSLRAVVSFTYSKPNGVDLNEFVRKNR